jgi:hypothetical protein
MGSEDPAKPLMNVIVDLEYPRLGSIRVDAFDQTPIDVRASPE